MSISRNLAGLALLGTGLLLGLPVTHQLQRRVDEHQRAVQAVDEHLHATEASYAHLAYVSGLLALRQFDYPAAVRHFETARQYAPDSAAYADALTQARGLLADTYR
jgi:hypothetical protein